MALGELQRSARRQNWAILLFALQIIVALIALIGAWYSLESIVFTGPLLATMGLVFAIVIRPLGSWVPLLFGLSAPFVSAVGAFIIAVFHLGPSEAQAPILVLLTIYMCLVVPMAIVSYAQIRQWPTRIFVGEPRAWRYSMKSLLGLMTGVAILTALLTSVVRSIYDFPLVFATFGSAVLVLAGLVAWRFSIYRSRIQYSRTMSGPQTVREWLAANVFASFRAQEFDVRCSFCGRPHRDAGPFAEGRGGILICGECADKCTQLIHDLGTHSNEGNPNRTAGDPTGMV